MAPVLRARPSVAAGLREVDRTGRILTLAPLHPPVAGERVADDLGVVTDLVEQALRVVVGDQVPLDQEPGVVGVRPDPRSAVVVHPVAHDRGASGVPELAATRAPTAG